MWDPPPPATSRSFQVKLRIQFLPRLLACQAAAATSGTPRCLPAAVNVCVCHVGRHIMAVKCVICGECIAAKSIFQLNLKWLKISHSIMTSLLIASQEVLCSGKKSPFTHTENISIFAMEGNRPINYL